MRPDKLWVVAKKDLAEFRTNKYVMYSILLMPLMLAVVLPVIYLMPFTMTGGSSEPLDVGNPGGQMVLVGETVTDGTYNDTIFDRCELVNVVADNCRFESSNLSNCLVRGSFVGNTTLNGSAMFHSNYLNITTINSMYSDSVDIGDTSQDEAFLLQFIDFLLIFFIMIPVILPTVMASYSFVGEKLNKSLEPLLTTPTTDSELLLGKATSIFLPCMAATWVAFVPFTMVVDYLTAGTLGYAPLPNVVWIIGVFILAPLFCIMSIALNVVVSSRVSDVRAPQQIGSLVVLPVVAFFIISLAGFFALGPEIMLVLCGIVLIADAGIMSLSLKTFQRENILVRWK